MPPTAELVGRVGRLTAQHPPTEHGLTLTVRVLPSHGQGVQQVTASALTSDTLGLGTQQGEVYAVHLKRQRFVRLDALQTGCTSAAFMTRLSRRLFVGCADGGVHCYDVSTSTHLAQLPGHRAAVGSLSTKSDTEQLLSASADAVLLWDMATFRQRRMLGDAPYGSSQAVFSAAGNVLAAASAGVVTLWDAKSLRELGQLRAPLGQQQQRFVISSSSISPDEQWLLVGCAAPALLLLYSLSDRALQCGLQLPQDMFGVAQVQVLPDSSSAAVLTSDGCISFVDLQGCHLAGQLQLTFPGCRALSFSTDPRANSMAVVCSDGLLRLYDLAVVRARQQAHTQPAQLQRLQEAQLLQLSTSAEVLPAADHAGFSTGRQPLPHKAAAGRGAASTVLLDVGNVQHGSRPGKASRPAAGPAAAGGSGVAAGSEQLRVRQLSEPAVALNKRKLQEMLLAFGGFPARYRRLIWEQLLQLPHNSAAFALLQDRGVHPAYKDLAQQLQAPGGTSSSVANRLAACLSQLAHWCPLFGEAGFLPDFVFPFIKLFGPKAESAFEAAATLLLNWCKGWFEQFPNPPLPLLRRFLLMLSQHDLQLGGHLQQLGVPLLERLWRVMSCGMSDLLPAAEDWLVLWDHCLAAPSGPAFYYSLLAAYLISRRSHLLAAANSQELDRLLEARPAVDVRRVVKLAHQLHECTPEYARLGVASLSPLPGGDSYPVFSDYPTGSVELQALERQRIQEAEEALIRRRQVVAELQQRSKQVAFEAAALTSQRQQLAALDAQRRAALRAIEDSLATAGARLDDTAKQEKLRQIRLAEEAYQASLASLRAQWSAELATLKADVDHKRRMAAATLKARQEEEDIKALEFQAQQRLWALQQEEAAAAGSSALRDAASTQASALAAQLQRKAAEWQAEDQARSLQQQHELARRARLAAAAEQEAALQAAQGILLAQELQTQEELAKVEHQRRLRQLAEDEAKLTAQQLQLQAERQAVADAAARQALQEQAQEQAARFSQRQEQRAGAVAAEYDSLQQQLAQLHLTAAGLGSSARLSEAQQQLAQMEATLATADTEYAARVASILGKVQAQRPVSGPARSPRERTAAAAPDLDSPAAATSTSMGTTDTSAATAAARTAAAVHEARLATSLEDVESRLAAIRQRRAALEELYGAQVDAEVGRLLADEAAQQRSQSLRASTTSVRSKGSSGAGAGRASPPEPTSAASAGSGSSGSSSRLSEAASGGSVDVSAELEHLLAEAEAEVQRELAAARVHLRGAGLQPNSSARTPPMQAQYPSLQSSVGRGRGRSTTGSVAQGSATASTGVAAGAGGQHEGSAGTAGSGDRRLKPVMEEPSAAAAAAAAAEGGAGAGPKPADSSSSSSSSPDRQGGDKGKESKAGAAGAAQPGDTTPASSAGATAEAAAAQLGSPGSSMSAGSAPPSGGLAGQGHGGAAAAATTAAYQPVLVTTPGRSRASADTERFLTAMSGGQGSPSSSGGGTTSSSVSKPGSLTFEAPAGSMGQPGQPPAATPTLGGRRTQARTAAAAAAHQQSGSEGDDGQGPAGGVLSARMLEPSGRVSAELRQSSSATSEELEQLLQQLSQYEEHLLEEAAGGPELGQQQQPQPAGRGMVGASLDSSMSWSQTLAGLTGLTNQDS